MSTLRRRLDLKHMDDGGERCGVPGQLGGEGNSRQQRSKAEVAHWTLGRRRAERGSLMAG